MKCLAKLPEGRYQTAEELLAAIEGLATPSGGMIATSGVRPSVASRFRMPSLVAVGVVAVALVAAIIVGNRGRNQLDANLIAVAPFDVLDPSLELWREGLVDLRRRLRHGIG